MMMDTKQFLSLLGNTAVEAERSLARDLEIETLKGETHKATVIAGKLDGIKYIREAVRNKMKLWEEED